MGLTSIHSTPFLNFMFNGMAFKPSSTIVVVWGSFTFLFVALMSMNLTLEEVVFQRAFFVHSCSTLFLGLFFLCCLLNVGGIWFEGYASYKSTSKFF